MTLRRRSAVRPVVLGGSMGAVVGGSGVEGRLIRVGFEVGLRAAGPTDVPAVAAVWAAGWRDGHLGHVPAALVAARTGESFGVRAGERVADTTVAVVDGVVAGFVMVVGEEVEQ